MNINNPTWPGKEGRSESEVFDSLLKYRRLASLSVERLRIVKELERLLPEDQAKFAEYLSDTISLYESECTLDIADFDPVPDDIQDIYYDKNTTLENYLYEKRELILDYLQELKSLWNKRRLEEVTAKLKEAHINDSSHLFGFKKTIEEEFSVLENMTMSAIKDSSDTQKNGELKKSLEKMRDDLRNNGYCV